MTQQAEHPLRALLLLCAKFLVIVIPATALWWLLLPYYGWVLVQIAGGILRAFGEAIEYGRVEPEGILNTSSKLVLGVAGVPLKMAVALLITNVPPYVALVLATGGLTVSRRLRILAVGVGILIVGHIGFIVYSLHFLGITTAREVSALPMAVMQFYLTLPFLLWLVLAYWDQLAAHLAPPGAQKPAPVEDRES